MRRKLAGAHAPWWAWVGLVHAGFVLVLYIALFKGGWSREALEWTKMMSLANENNFAVWWSGACLLTPGIVFLWLGLRVGAQVRDRVMWVALASVMMGLSLDEVGSLHERISLTGGWRALLPFAAIGFAVFVYAFIRMARSPDTRAGALLIMLSLLLFLGIAALEHLESISFFRGAMARWRLLVEEAVELGAGMLLLFAGALQLKRTTGERNNRVSILVAPRTIPSFEILLFLGLVGHGFAAILFSPELRLPGRGNPEMWYPMTVFLLVAVQCAKDACEPTRSRPWFLALAIVFVLLSMGQLQNFGSFFEAIAPGTIDKAYYGDWLLRVVLTAAPVLAAAAWLTPWRMLAAYSVSLLLAGILLYPGARFFESYYLFSALAAFCAYRVVVCDWSRARPAEARRA